MVEPLRHRQTKGAATDMPGRLPPRHIPTLPFSADQPSRRERLLLVESECGAVAVGRTYLLPPLSSGGASLPHFGRCLPRA
jgi:hypothetical protein